MPKADYQFKLVIVGDSNVGKTSLLRRFTKDEFDHGVQPTVGLDYATRQIEHEGKVIEAHVWDTGGQERHRTIIAGFYRSSAGALIVFDLTNRASFERCNKWLQELRSHRGHGEPHLPMVAMLVGNKSDAARSRVVDYEDAKDFAADNNLAYVECSASDGSNVDLAFETCLLEVYRKVRKAIEAGKCNPDRPSPSLHNVVLITPAQQARDEGTGASGCC